MVPSHMIRGVDPHQASQPCRSPDGVSLCYSLEPRMGLDTILGGRLLARMSSKRSILVAWPQDPGRGTLTRAGSQRHRRLQPPLTVVCMDGPCELCRNLVCLAIGSYTPSWMYIISHKGLIIAHIKSQSSRQVASLPLNTRSQDVSQRRRHPISARVDLESQHC